jgi:CheY-like chemotaxis protein
MTKKKILIIDDEPDVITYLTAVLSSNGYDVFAMSDVKHAIEDVRKFRPDLICLDIVMPHETGISFYSKLKEDKTLKKIPVMIISGVVETGKFDFHSYVADESVPVPEYCMEKPIDVNNFIKMIEDLTSKKDFY